METRALLGRINAALNTDYRLESRYAGGENHGAYRVSDAAGTAFVLKYAVLKHHNQTDILPRLLRARALTARLRELGVPTPEYLHIGTLAETVYWLQTALPGEPPEHLTATTLDRFLEWNERQAGQAISSEQDWSCYVRAMVFAGESGWAASLKGYSAETRALLGRLAGLTAGKEAAVSRSADIVHGDLGPSNVLAAEGTLTGIVDWDAAGCGDRALDLSKLLFYSFEDDALRRRLWGSIIQTSGHDALVVYLAYNILAQLDWSIRHHTPEAVATWLAKSALMLDMVVAEL